MASSTSLPISVSKINGIVLGRGGGLSHQPGQDRAHKSGKTQVAEMQCNAGRFMHGVTPEESQAGEFKRIYASGLRVRGFRGPGLSSGSGPGARLASFPSSFPSGTWNDRNHSPGNGALPLELGNQDCAEFRDRGLQGLPSTSFPSWSREPGKRRSFPACSAIEIERGALKLCPDWLAQGFKPLDHLGKVDLQALCQDHRIISAFEHADHPARSW